MTRLFFTVYLVIAVVVVYHDGGVVKKVFNFKVVKFAGSLIKGVEDDVDFGSGSQDLSHFQELAEYFVIVFEVEVLVKH